MKIFKITLRFILLIAMVAIFTKTFIVYKCGFRIDKIEPKEFFDNHFEVDITKNNEPLVLNQIILNQKYRFLNKGRQSFVFESKDKNYVLKLFRFHRYRNPFFCNFISFFSFGERYIKNLQNERNDLYFKTMNSYRLVSEMLKEETATIFVHLNKTKKLNVITIEDRFKNNYKLDLNEYGFVVQKKASSFKKALLNIKNDKHKKDALLLSFFDNLQAIYNKNLVNKDRHVLQNLGIIDNNKVVEIDVGRFVLKKDFSGEKIKKEAYHYTTYLKKWISKNMPDALELVDKKLIELSNIKNKSDQVSLKGDF